MGSNNEEEGKSKTAAVDFTKVRNGETKGVVRLNFDSIEEVMIGGRNEVSEAGNANDCEKTLAVPGHLRSGNGFCFLRL